MEYLGRDRQRNRGFFSGIIRGVWRPCELPKVVLFPLPNLLVSPVTSQLGWFAAYLSLIPDRGAADHLPQPAGQWLRSVLIRGDRPRSLRDRRDAGRFLSLSKRFIVIVAALTGVIGCFETARPVLQR